MEAAENQTHDIPETPKKPQAAPKKRLHDKEAPEIAKILEDSWGWSYPSQKTIEMAKQSAKYRKMRIGDVIVDMGLMEEKEKELLAKKKPASDMILEFISKKVNSVRRRREELLALTNGYPYYTDFSSITPHPDLVMPAVLNFCDEKNAALMQIERRTPVLIFSTYQDLRAYVHQGKELQIKNPIRKALGVDSARSVRVAIAPQQDIGAIVAKAYQNQTEPLDVGKDSSEDIWYAFQSPTNTIQRFARLMDEGIVSGSTDISIVPQKDSDGSRIYLRQYGVMHPSVTLPRMNQQETAETVRFLLTRSGANPEGGALREPRDGQITYISSQGEAYVRCSFIPAIRLAKSANMEPVSVSLRLLSRSMTNLQSLESANIHPVAIKTMTNAMTYSQGMIIVSGPTNSGKSTTIAGMLSKHNEIYSHMKKRLSIEDPVEQYLQGITQFQVPAHMRDQGFATIMRSILRHDPDVIWIGEVRDDETAQTAVRAASSGHLVMTTVHANDSIMAWKVIDNMVKESDRINLVESLSLIISQRLVRTACPKCSNSMRDISEEELEVFRYYCEQKEDGATCAISLPQQVVDINEEGCSYCKNGFAGVAPINEVLPISREIKNALHERKGNTHSIVNSKRKLTLMDNALELIRAGKIDIHSALV